MWYVVEQRVTKDRGWELVKVCYTKREAKALASVTTHEVTITECLPNGDRVDIISHHSKVAPAGP